MADVVEINFFRINKVQVQNKEQDLDEIQSASGKKNPMLYVLDRRNVQPQGSNNKTFASQCQPQLKKSSQRSGLQFPLSSICGELSKIKQENTKTLCKITTKSLSKSRNLSNTNWVKTIRKIGNKSVPLNTYSSLNIKDFSLGLSTLCILAMIIQRIKGTGKKLALSDSNTLTVTLLGSTAILGVICA